MLVGILEWQFSGTAVKRADGIHVPLSITGTFLFFEYE